SILDDTVCSIPSRRKCTRSISPLIPVLEASSLSESRPSSRARSSFVAIWSCILTTSSRIASTVPAMKPMRFSSSELFMITVYVITQAKPKSSRQRTQHLPGIAVGMLGPGSHRGHIGFTHIKICRDLLHVVVVFKRFHQLHHLTCL